MFHVCVFTDSAHQKFIITGGLSEKEIKDKLSRIIAEKYSKRVFNKLVVFKSFLMISDGEAFLAAIKNMDSREILRFISSENPTMVDLSHHLVNQ